MRKYSLQKTIFMTLAVCSVLGAAHTAWANENDDAKIIAPMVDWQTTAVLRIDPAHLGPPLLAEKLSEMVPVPSAASGSPLTLWKGVVETTRAALGDRAIYWVCNASAQGFFFIQKGNSLDLEKLQKVPIFFNTSNIIEREEHVIFISGSFMGGFNHYYEYVRNYLDTLKPSPRPEIAEAFDAVEGFPVQMLLVPPAYARRAIEEMLPELPEEIGGGPSRVLTDGLRWVAIGIDPAKISVRMVIQSTDDEAAARLAKQLPVIVRTAHEKIEPFSKKINAEQLETLLATFSPKAEGSQLILTLDDRKIFASAFSVMVQKASKKYQLTVTQNNMKHILIGMQTFHAKDDHFPPPKNDRDENGKPRLSWRVHLLPFLEEGELFKQFHLDEPWDSPHNIKLLEKMPKVFQTSGSQVKSGYTTLLAPVGKDTVFGSGEPVKIQNITDGTVNTIALVEVRDELAVPWTKPEDYRYDESDPAAGLKMVNGSGFAAGFCDASVRNIRADVEPGILLRLFQKADGCAIDLSQIKVKFP